MTTITIFKSSENIVGFRAYGHAGFDRRGRDIVCSAISMITINFINSVEKFTDDRYEYDTNEKDGMIYFQFSSLPSHDAKLLMDSLMLGLESIVTSYGDKYLRLEYKEV